LEVGHEIYEAIPQQLIIKAAMLAANELLGETSV